MPTPDAVTWEEFRDNFC
jgi:hypothetical protein